MVMHRRIPQPAWSGPFFVMTSVEFPPASVTLSLAKGRVFKGYLAVTMAILHVPLLRFITSCNSEERLEPSSSSVPERVLQPLGCQIFRGEGKRVGSCLLLKLFQYTQIMTIHYRRDRDWWHRHVIRAITWEVGESGSGPCSNEYLIINMRWNSSVKPGKAAPAILQWFSAAGSLLAGRRSGLSPLFPN